MGRIKIMVIHNKKYYLVLLLVVLFAGFLRLYRLDSYPAGFHIDEASLGYNGYSLLKTGKDENGNRFPLYIDMFGDNRPSGYHYLTMAPIAVFGLNEFATRLPGAVFGTLTVVALYFFVLVLFKDKKLALLCSFLMAISPWHVVSSRASAESVVALFFILSGIGIIVQSFNTRKSYLLPFGFISLGFSFFFYHTPRIFVPLLLVCIIAFIWKSLKTYSKTFKLTGLVCSIGVFSISFLLIFVVNGGTGRFNQVNIFGSPETKLVMEEQLREDGSRTVQPLISRVFHNKVINYSETFLSNYLDYFSGNFLFMSGGRPLWYKVPNVGMMLIMEFPFIIVGFIYLIIQGNNLMKIPLIWLFIAPIVASITMDDIPNVQRSLVMFPMLEVVAAYGIVTIVTSFLKKKWNIIILFFVLAFLFNFAYFLHQYFVHGSSHQTINRFNGFKEMVLSVKDVYKDFDSIIITKTSGGIYPHVLFFMAYDPDVYQKEGSPKDKDFGGFGKFIFAKEFCPSINGSDRFPKTGKILYVDSGTCVISPILKQKNIYREDGTVAFIIVYP